MRAEEGPDGPEAPIPSVSVERVLEEFRALKTGEGLTPQKMVYPVAATQRLLDNLADLNTDDGRALEWALKADPAAHSGATLDARRARSGVPENTAKDRERRAVIALFERWGRGHEDWASSVFTVHASALPASVRVKFGSLLVKVRVYLDDDGELPVVLFELEGPYPPGDFLTLAGKVDQALVVYGTVGFTWRLELWLPSFGAGDVRVVRVHRGRRPALVRVEQSTADGRAVEEKVDGARFDGETIITMRTPNLDPPCPISWDWDEPESERRPAVTFPEAPAS
jgi:hypothetical protein